MTENVMKHKDNHIIIFQKPNLPLITWGVATVAAKFISHGTLHQVLSAIAFVAIVIWALLEIFSGVNYFRRALGLIVLALSIYSRL